MKSTALLGVWCLIGATCWTWSCAVVGAEEVDASFFEKKIRPVLVEKCYGCHGADAQKRKGGLRVDSRDGLRRGGDSGPAVVPGKIAESLLIQAIEHAPDFYEMPPDGKLPVDVIADFRKWVESGAADPRTETPASPEAVSSRKVPTVEEGRNFWSFRPLTQPPIPVVARSDWPQTSLDCFLLAPLEAKQFPVAARIGRESLVRRLYLDLVGLPPDLSVVDAFLNAPESEANTAYERLVDQLLNAPQFGERWARNWLDVYRFAESSGGGRTLLFNDAWRYRDYVIDAVNADRSFQEQIIEQIAGDLLPADDYEVRRRNLIATAFLALGPTNYERQDKELLEMDVIDEQLETIGRAFLGMTLGCARCHDHKFDPIPTSDYYAMAGILRSTRTLIHENVSKWVDASLPVAPAEETVLREKEERIAALTKEVQAAKKAASQAADRLKMTVTPVAVAVAMLPGIIVDDAAATQVGSWTKSTYVTRHVGEGYLHDDNQHKGEKTLTFMPRIAKGGRYEVRFAYTPAANRASNVPVTIFHADGENVVTVDERKAPAVDGYFVSLGEFRFEPNGQGFVLVATEGTDGHVVADAVQFLSMDEAKVALPQPDTVQTAAAADRKVGRGLASVANAKELEAKLKELVDRGPKRELTMSVCEHERIEDCPILVRGNLATRGKVVPRGFLSVVTADIRAPIPPEQSGRLQFAEWIANDRNPLTPRVVVNRVWHWLFGVGLVRSTDLFGATGEPPSHPELLDHLARRFVSEDWSLKRLIRTLVLSEAYRMSTAADPAVRQQDPDNRWLARMPRRRLTAETLRDIFLWNSNRLDLRVGGRNIAPGTTIEYGYEFTDRRRSIYTPVFRNTLPRWYEAFDFANPNQTLGRRETSTSSAQALFLMNDPFALDHFQAAADQLLSEPTTGDRERIILAYRKVLGRSPTDAEAQIVLEHLAQTSAMAPRTVWTHLFQGLYSTVEFRFVP